MKDKRQDMLDQIEVLVFEQIERAHLDSMINGTGFLMMSQDGLITHITLDDLKPLVDELIRARFISN